MKKKIVNILIILSIITLIISFILLIKKSNNINDLKAEKQLIEVIKKELNIVYETSGEKEILKYRDSFKNEDIVATLQVADILDIPIVQGNNNTYYLKHSLNKEKVPGGSVFIDYRTNLNNKQINIYGHNSTRYDVSFKKLENYLNNDFIKQNSIITLKTTQDIRIYQIFAVSIVPRTSKTEHYYFDYDSGTEWKKHYERLRNNSFYKNDIELLETDEIIILQTCLFGSNRNKLLVVAAKRFK